ncbi:MAG: SAM-dependent methyltransferase [Firmicutes bacterium]|nr:SAM-dependent methyltransferase [Bacillota bacterium]
MQLTPRLQAVADMVPAQSIVADIGTDHCYIPIYLHKQKITSRLIATDNKPGPLAAARNTLALFNLEKIIDLRLGEGLAPLEPSDAVSTVIIAGMGGETICSILASGRQLLTEHVYLIIQPMTNSQDVRVWLAENGFHFVQEELVREEKHIYEIIGARFSGKQEDYELLQLAIGPLLVQQKHPLLTPLLQEKIGKLQKNIQAASRADSYRARKRVEELEQELCRLERVLKWLSD